MMQSSLARKLRVLRAAKGWTLREAAAEVGCTKETLSNLERGLQHPHDITLSRIAEGYGVAFEELLEEPEAALAGSSSKAEASETGQPEVSGRQGEARLDKLHAVTNLVQDIVEEFRTEHEEREAEALRTQDRRQLGTFMAKIGWTYRGIVNHIRGDVDMQRAGGGTLEERDARARIISATEELRQIGTSATETYLSLPEAAEELGANVAWLPGLRNRAS